MTMDDETKEEKGCSFVNDKYLELNPNIDVRIVERKHTRTHIASMHDKKKYVLTFRSIKECYQLKHINASSPPFPDILNRHLTQQSTIFPIF